MCRQQKAVRGMKFGDLKNSIDNAIRVGVIEDDPTTDSLHNIPNPDVSTNAIQHDLLVDNEEHQVDNANDTNEAEGIEIEDAEDSADYDNDESNNDQEDSIDDSSDDQEDDDDGVAPENMEDEAITEIEVNNSDLIYRTMPGRERANHVIMLKIFQRQTMCRLIQGMELGSNHVITMILSW